MDDSELYTVMRVCAHNLHKLSDGRAGQRRLISILLEKDGIPQRELQDIVVVRSGSLSEVLGKLEASGLIERRESAEDRRRVCIYLTKEGRHLARETVNIRTVAIDEVFSCLTDVEKQQLGALVTRLNARFEEIRPPEHEEDHRRHRDCDHHREDHHDHGRHKRD